jgi:hypothetical protein
MTRSERLEQKPTLVLYAAIALCLAGVFVADLLTPLGVTLWVVYLVPIVLSLFVWRPVTPLLIAGLATLLTASGYVLAPQGVDPVVPQINRGVGI